MDAKATSVAGAWLLAAALLGTAASSCAMTHQYVHKNVPNQVLLTDSQGHSFEYVNVTEDTGDLVIYGKIDHHHVSCSSEGHVDVAIVGAGGEVLLQRSIAIVPRSKRPPGWSGAAFRARLPMQLPKGHEVRLAFHDACVPTELFDCAANRAAREAPAE